MRIVRDPRREPQDIPDLELVVDTTEGTQGLLEQDTSSQISMHVHASSW